MVALWKEVYQDERGVSRKEVYQGKRCIKERGVSRKEVFQGKRCFKERGVSRKEVFQEYH